MYSFDQLKASFEDYLNTFEYPKAPASLYDPVSYIMQLGGKRLRPLLTLAAYNLYYENIGFAYQAAMCVELFHNFSLVHDDIMDEADLRRGHKSVHAKYDTNTAILSGDVMLIMTYQLLEHYPEFLPDLLHIYNKTAQEVCDGQRMDMDFEQVGKVTIEDYIQMITYKTSVLVACALKMGAIVAGASASDQNHLYEFGKNLGIAFQIQDDILDTFGDGALTGKKVGGDIIQKKKTYLYLKSLDLLSETQQQTLLSLFGKVTIDDEQKHISEVKELFEIAHVRVHAEELKLVYKQLAMSHLQAISCSEDKKKVLHTFADKLINRNT